MKNLMRFAFSLAILTGLWACAGTPGPGDAGYPYNVSGVYTGEMYVEGMVFVSSLDLQTGAGGELRGTYQVTDPVDMSGSIIGSIAADTIRFSMVYTNPMDGCGGTVDGTGVVEEGGGEFEGRIEVDDSCAGFISGTYSFSK